MLRSLSAMRTAVLLAVGNHAQILSTEADALIQQSHREIAEDFEWSDRRRDALISLVTPYTTGTVTVTAASAVVTGASTVWTSAMTGRAITISGDQVVLYVGTVDSGTQLNLVDAQGAAVLWAATGGAAKTYSIFKHQYALPTDLAKVRWPTKEFPLDEVTTEYLNAKDPGRSTRGRPTKFALSNVTITGATPAVTRYIEFWPIPSAAELLQVPYLVEPPALTGTNDLPVCPAHLIELQAQFKACLFLYSKTGDAKWSTLALLYTGEFDKKLERAKVDDESKYGLPMQLGVPAGIVGFDRLALRDWELG